jgi:DNA modification methylase
MNRPEITYRDASTTLWLGDALDTLRRLPDRSADCVVTSPPYYQLRDYQTAQWVDGTPACDHRPSDGPVCLRCGAVRADRQYGLEPTPDKYVRRMRTVFAEVQRVLADDGTLWLNLGDSYSSGRNPSPNEDFNERWHGAGNSGQRKQERGRPSRRRDRAEIAAARRAVAGQPAKNLLMIPERTVLALQDDGWILRNKIIWHKPNAMPSSVRDRLTNRYEYIYLLVKQPRYAFALDEIREPHSMRPQRRPSGRKTRQKLGVLPAQTHSTSQRDELGCDGHPLGKNPGDVWSISTRPFPAAHFAVFPIDLPLRCIKAGCKPGGIVLDPFSGAGTTGLAALQLDRRYIGIDLNRAYHDLAVQRLTMPLRA